MVTVNRSNDTLQLTQHEIESYCKTFLKEAYNLELTIPVVINSRLSSTLGSLTLIGRSEPRATRMQFSKKYLIHGDLDDIISTIKHECIHYALFTLGKPYRDGTELFESELRKYGSSSTETSELTYERNVRVYQCKCNEHVYLRTIRPSMCIKCNHNLQYVGRRKQLM